MSAFLGPIHHWLYNKVQWHEALLGDIINKFNITPETVENINNRFGYPVTEALENVIDTDNIHGWLQTKIESLELRTAFVVTNILNQKPDAIIDLRDLYMSDGMKARLQLPEMDLPESVFKGLQNHLLDGMPCDRVNQPLSVSPTEISWEKRVCIHSQYWNAVEGDIDIFNDLRNHWIKAFLPENMTFESRENNVFAIKRS